MFSGKNIGYIALLAIAGVLIYYFFFRKKEEAKVVEKPADVKPEEKPSGRNVGLKNATGDMVIHLTPKVATPADQSYVGPQDCAENCNLPYHTRLLYCYYRMNGDPECLSKAERLKQECLGKCSDSLPRYKNLGEVATPLQEDNYNGLFNNLFNQGYV